MRQFETVLGAHSFLGSPELRVLSYALPSTFLAPFLFEPLIGCLDACPRCPMEPRLFGFLALLCCPGFFIYHIGKVMVRSHVEISKYDAQPHGCKL